MGNIFLAQQDIFKDVVHKLCLLYIQPYFTKGFYLCLG